MTKAAPMEGKTTDHTGEVTGQTTTSSGWSLLNWSSPMMTRTVPVYRPDIRAKLTPDSGFVGETFDGDRRAPATHREQEPWSCPSGRSECAIG